MIRKEFKNNFKNFIIWLSVLILMFGFVFIIYPYIINDETMQSMEDMMKTMPEEMLKAFNMDMTSISTAYGWLKSEGFTFILLIIGIYSSILGGTILLKEESDKTIEYLHSLPITRSNIVTNKVIVGIFYIILMVVLLGVFNYIALTLSGDFDHKQYLLLSVTPLFVGLPLFAFNLFISTFMHKTKKTIGISLGLVFIFYLFSILSEITESVEFMKYFTIYTLADIRNVIIDVSINPIMIIISISITLIFIILTYFRYDNKELVA